MSQAVKVAAGITFLGLIGFGFYLLVKPRKGQLGRERLPGGKGAGKRPHDFDPRQLKVGVEIEMEHTRDRRVAREIAMDHLTENPRYYTALCKFEQEPACAQLGVIRDIHDERTTPKQFAQELIMDGVALKRGYWTEDAALEDNINAMTERERNLIDDQLKKQGDRVAKMFGYKESWSQ